MGIDCKNTDEHTRLVTGQTRRQDTRRLHGFPRHLKQQALLGIEDLRLTRRDSEKEWFEFMYVALKKTPPAHIGFRRGLDFLGIEAFDAPTLLRDIGNRFPLGAKK